MLELDRSLSDTGAAPEPRGREDPQSNTTQAHHCTDASKTGNVANKGNTASTSAGCAISKARAEGLPIIQEIPATSSKGEPESTPMEEDYDWQPDLNEEATASYSAFD